MARWSPTHGTTLNRRGSPSAAWSVHGRPSRARNGPGTPSTEASASAAGVSNPAIEPPDVHLTAYHRGSSSGRAAYTRKRCAAQSTPSSFASIERTVRPNSTARISATSVTSGDASPQRISQRRIYGGHQDWGQWRDVLRLRQQQRVSGCQLHGR